jgi:hypothetical protein
MSASLTYSIFEGTLTGILSGTLIHMEALSGGAGGSTRHSATDAANNPYDEGLKTSGAAGSSLHIHGGPIPPGRYTIDKPAHHGHLGLAARLNSGLHRPFGRDGFFIHGRGPHGSDGCIVPLHPADFGILMAGLAAENGGTLFVEETGNGDRFA